MANDKEKEAPEKPPGAPDRTPVKEPGQSDKAPIKDPLPEKKKL